MFYRKDLEKRRSRTPSAELTQQYRDEFCFTPTKPLRTSHHRRHRALPDLATVSLARKPLSKRELRPTKKHGNMPL